MFINMIKSNANPSNEGNFELVSYKSHNIKMMQAAISEEDIEDDDEIPFAARSIVTDRLYGYIESLKHAKTLDKAKQIVKNFYKDINNLESDPIIVHAILDREIKEGIMEIHDCLNETLDELRNPFKRRKAKEIAERYIESLKLCHSTNDIYKIDEILEDAQDAFNDLLD